MQVRIKNDEIEIDGYVNAIERKSRPIKDGDGQFVERICKGAFKKALERAEDVRLLLNHNWDKDLGGIKDGNLELTEDNIGLRARATIRDKDVVDKARKGDLIGWSFGFEDRDADRHEENGMMTRDVKDLDLYEVSLIDRSKRPAYDGTLITVRTEEDVHCRGEVLETEMEIRKEPDEEVEQHKKEGVDKPIDYSNYETMIKEMKEDF